MARLTPRPVPTEMQTLKPLLRYCPTCGETLWAAYHNYRTITTLEAVLGLTLQIRRCLNQACPHVHHPHRPEQEGRLALPKHEFGLDVIAFVGQQRYGHHRSVPDIHQALRENAAWRWLHGRSPLSWSVTTHWSPSRCKTRRASNASPRSAVVSSWPSMASNPMSAMQSSGCCAMVSQARYSWPGVCSQPPTTLWHTGSTRCSRRYRCPWSGSSRMANPPSGPPWRRPCLLCRTNGVSAILCVKPPSPSLQPIAMPRKA